MFRHFISKTMKRLPVLSSSGNKSNNNLPFCYGLILTNNDPAESNSINFSTESTSSQTKSSEKDSTTKIEENPFYSKYAEKIKKAQLLKQNSACDKKLEQNNPNPDPESKQSICLQSEINTVKESIVKSSQTITSKAKSKKRLDDIIKLDMIQDKTKDEIIQIWNEYHSKRDCLYAVLPTDLYENFYENLSQYPTFILPLPRDDKNNSDQKTNPQYEFFLMQFQEHCCYFTPLAAYHLHQEMAPVCLSIHYYPELSQTKQIVLMMGEFDSNILNIFECQLLANQLQYYYLTKEPAPRLSLHLFNKEPKKFDHMRLIQHLEAGFTSGPMINLNQQD